MRERKVRHERVAARRAKELLCVFNEDTPDAEDALWVDEKEVDSDFVPAFSELLFKITKVLHQSIIIII